MSLFEVAVIFRQLVSSLAGLNVRGMVYSSYVVLNSLLLAGFGRQFRFPLARHRCESFQTRRRMMSLLKRAGFTGWLDKRYKFAISATKR